jgi:hypothetical protein
MGFLLTAVSAVVLLHGYLYWRLVHSVSTPGGARRLGLVVLLLLMVSTLAALGLRRVLAPTAATALDWVGRCCPGWPGSGGPGPT